MQGGHPVVIPNVDVLACGQENSDHVLMSGNRCIMYRPTVFAIADGRIGAPVQQHFHNLRLSAIGGPVQRGQVVAQPGTITPHTKFKAEAYILTKEEGGRHTPFFNGYRPQFYFRTTDVTGVVTLPEGVEMVMPGDNVTMEISLIMPIAMEKELRFAIREGGRTVGAGVISEIVE